MSGPKKRSDEVDPLVVEEDGVPFEDAGTGGTAGDPGTLSDAADRDFGWDEGDPADRRRDPLRKP